MSFPLNHIQEKDDCFRCCIACVLDKHPSKVPYYPPFIKGENTFNSHLDDYDNWLKEKYGQSLFFSDHPEFIKSLLNNKKLWIARVRAYPNRDIKHHRHAIVMNGAKLYYDPHGKYGRKQKPKKLYRGYVIGEIDSINDDGSNNIIY